ncbi:hypothetical protein CcI49_23105 [Frankia sp. CcI49]|uniref:hypothetical protein n=1 Tax=Frankia sp. CcI49 TaxID=1745382 RepID=UPI000977CED3|nr:hypothetical protein [Frankia sp. CcI49]ONH58346.1 hypothetical protein CcI49_23105 [Frankia sp. CcI49]
MSADLDTRIIAAEATFVHHAQEAIKAGAHLADLVIERVAAVVRQVWPQATEVTVDSDNNLHWVFSGDLRLADDGDERFEDVAEQVRDDLLLIGQTGRFADDDRVVNFDGAGS